MALALDHDVGMGRGLPTLERHRQNTLHAEHVALAQDHDVEMGGRGGCSIFRVKRGVEGWGWCSIFRVKRGAGVGKQYQEEGGGVGGSSIKRRAGGAVSRGGLGVGDGGGIPCTLDTGGGLLCVFLFNFACSFPPPTCLEVMHQVILMNPRHFAGVEELVELIHAQGPSLGILVGPDLLPANKHGKNDAIRSVVKQETQRSTKK